MIFMSKGKNTYMATKVKIHYFNTEEERLTYEKGVEYTKPYVS